jgi:hypothetical protein
MRGMEVFTEILKRHQVTLRYMFLDILAFLMKAPHDLARAMEVFIEIIQKAPS